MSWFADRARYVYLVLALVGALAVLSVAVAAESSTDSESGTVNGKTWRARSTVTQLSITGGNINFSGTSFTEYVGASGPFLNQIAVTSRGQGNCGVISVGSGWSADGTLFNTWIVGRSGLGTFPVGRCSIYPGIGHPGVLSNKGDHFIHDDDPVDGTIDVDTAAHIILPDTLSGAIPACKLTLPPTC